MGNPRVKPVPFPTGPWGHHRCCCYTARLLIEVADSEMVVVVVVEVVVEVEVELKAKQEISTRSCDVGV